MTKVTIDRELLERIPLDVLKTYGYAQTAHKIESILAAPPQPEGGGLDVVGWIAPENIARMKRGGLCGFMVQDKQDDRRTCAVVTAEDAQRAIAELREECERLREERDSFQRVGISAAEQATKGTELLAAAYAERETLRQQLAERDARMTEAPVVQGPSIGQKAS